MSSPIEVDQSDHTPETLESMSHECKDDNLGRRLRAIAMILRGVSRGEVGHAHGVDRQTVRDWVIRFNEFGPDGLRDQPRGGGTCRLSEDQLAELAEILKEGPSVERDGVFRWRIRDVRDWILTRFGVTYTLEGARGLMHRLLQPDPSAHPSEDKLCRSGKNLQ